MEGLSAKISLAVHETKQAGFIVNIGSPGSQVIAYARALVCIGLEFLRGLQIVLRNEFLPLICAKSNIFDAHFG